MRHNEPVSHIMSTETVTAHIAQKPSEVYRLLTENSIHHVPVVNGKKLVGMISSQFSIDKIMSTDLNTIKADDAIRSAAEKLSEGGHHSLAVVDNDGDLVGIVTTTDLVKYLLAQY